MFPGHHLDFSLVEADGGYGKRESEQRFLYPEVVFRITLAMCAFLVSALWSLWPGGGHTVDTIAHSYGGESGVLQVLTYNVAGLPAPISPSKPHVHSPLISPLVAELDLVLFQEDFCYHSALVDESSQPHRSSPEFEPGCTSFLGGNDFGDGLNRLSQDAFVTHARFDWEACHGRFYCHSDCLASKGFSVAEHHLGGVPVHIYNLHMDAGGCDGDRAARGAQMQQLMHTLRTRSAGVAVVVAGDFNLDGDNAEDMALLSELLANQTLSDACRIVDCGDERLDRVLYRGSGELTLQAVTWDTPDHFVTPGGEPLSDHEPVLVSLAWFKY